MDRQEIIQTLKQYRGLRLECERLCKRITTKKNDMYDIKACVMSAANVRTGEMADRVERVVEMMDSMVDYYSRKMEECEKSERQIAEMIDRISDSEERGVLFLHYIEGKTFMEIGEEMYLSERTIWYRHNNAINKLCALVQ